MRSCGFLDRIRCAHTNHRVGFQHRSKSLREQLRASSYLLGDLIGSAYGTLVTAAQFMHNTAHADIDSTLPQGSLHWLTQDRLQFRRGSSRWIIEVNLMMFTCQFVATLPRIMVQPFYCGMLFRIRS